MRAIDESPEIGFGSEVGIDGGEIRRPIAVIACAFLAGFALHRLVLEYGADPDRRRAKVLDIVEPGREALQVPTVIEICCRGIIAGLQAIALDPAPIVPHVAIFETVRKEEVDNLVLGQARPIVLRRSHCRRENRGDE